MGRSYSKDLRERVVASVEQGGLSRHEFEDSARSVRQTRHRMLYQSDEL